MSSTQYIAKMNAHMKRRAQLLSALDKAVNQVGHKKIALALADKVKTTA